MTTERSGVAAQVGRTRRRAGAARVRVTSVRGSAVIRFRPFAGNPARQVEQDRRNPSSPKLGRGGEPPPRLGRAKIEIAPLVSAAGQGWTEDLLQDDRCAKVLTRADEGENVAGRRAEALTGRHRGDALRCGRG